MMGKTWVKFCGFTRPDDVEAACELGVDAIGLNIWPRSKRSVSLEQAARLTALVGGRAEVILVTVDSQEAELREALSCTGADAVQLHGDEPQALLQSLGETVAFKALGLQDAQDVERALAWPGYRILIDVHDPALRGGTGRRLSVELAAPVIAAQIGRAHV